MTPVRDAYLVAAASAAGLVGDPAVAAAWNGPSALTGFTVGGLAAHLAGQIITAHRVLAEPQPEGELVSLLGHYERVTWIGAGPDDEINVVIRAGGEEVAAEGPAALAERTAASVAWLREALAVAPPERAVSPPAGPWLLPLDDFLTTRMMEIVVHSDDLACSVGGPTPELPPEVTGPVLALLTTLAVRRHGATALLRALSRAERAPATIAAF